MEVRSIESIVRALSNARVDYLVLKLWSEEHRRTPIDIFVYEPFPFESELARALRLELLPGIWAPVVTLDTLLAMKRTAGRPQDLIDITELERLR